VSITNPHIIILAFGMAGFMVFAGWALWRWVEHEIASDDDRPEEPSAGDGGYAP